MADIIYITASGAFFGVCFLFAKACATVFHSNEHEQGMEDIVPGRIN